MASKLTPELKRRLRALWLPKCIECEGSGTIAGESLIVGGPCHRCEGLGYTLRDATGNNWPWWEGSPFSNKRDHAMVPRLPTFTDPRDAVVLLERMAALHILTLEAHRVDPPGNTYLVRWPWGVPGKHQTVGGQTVGGQTLARALLGVLAEVNVDVLAPGLALVEART